MSTTADPARGGEPLAEAAASGAVSFTEEMKGWVALGEVEHERGRDLGQERGTFFMFHLTITAPDIEHFLSDSMHEATAQGWVRCEELGGRLPVEHGVFNLFVEGPDPGERRMLYRLYFRDGVGHPLTLSGFKRIHNGSALAMWPETTTLYTRLLTGHVGPEDEAAAEVVAAGILRILKRDFARQLTTFRGRGESRSDGIRALVSFNRLFAGVLIKVYPDEVALGSVLTLASAAGAVAGAGRACVSARRRRVSFVRRRRLGAFTVSNLECAPGGS